MQLNFKISRSLSVSTWPFRMDQLKAMSRKDLFSVLIALAIAGLDYGNTKLLCSIAGIPRQS
jgi:hypothetical protein